MKPHDGIPVHLTFAGGKSTTSHRGKSTLKDDCMLDSTVSELRNVRIKSICTAEMILDSVCRHCQGSGLNVGGGNAGQLCLLLSHDADLLCCWGAVCFKLSVFL